MTFVLVVRTATTFVVASHCWQRVSDGWSCAGNWLRLGSTYACLLEMLLATGAEGASKLKLKLSIRPELRQDYPLNLSISISGGKETNKDSLSNGE